jgi:tetratricopeptide (TPR) repeat protein
LFILLFGGLSLMRREGLSGRFALEALANTAGGAALAAANLFPLHPVLFLLLLYLVTMRVRLLVDVGNFFAMRGQFIQAQALYTLARRLLPDTTARLIVEVNEGTLKLQQGSLDQAVRIFQGVLEQAPHGRLGLKYEAASHYNLGVAYLRKGQESLAARAFNAAIDAWPASEYSRRATLALEKIRLKK